MFTTTALNVLFIHVVSLSSLCGTLHNKMVCIVFDIKKDRKRKNTSSMTHALLWTITIIQTISSILFVYTLIIALFYDLSAFGNFTMDVLSATAFGIQVNAAQDKENDFVKHAKKFFVMDFVNPLVIAFGKLCDIHCHHYICTCCVVIWY